MDSGTLIGLLTSWQFLFIAACMILLLPLIVYISSRSSRRGPRLSRPRGRARTARPRAKPAPAREEAGEEE